MHTIKTPSEEVKYTVIRSARRTMAIIVKRDGSVMVRAPLKTAESTARSFVESRASWILKHSLRSRLRHESAKKYFTDGEYHPYLGRQIRLTIRETGCNRYFFGNDELIIETKEKWNPDKGKTILNGIYRTKAGEIFQNRMANLIKKHSGYGFQPAGLKVRTTASRWGSCSPHGEITLSSNLLKSRPKLIDFVILHELCHLRHRNHGKDFYRLLASVCPDYKTLNKELKESEIS